MDSSSQSTRVVVTGGGTGGHIYPALAVAQALLNETDGVDVLYVGNATSLESQLVPQQGIPFESISFSGMPRGGGLGRLVALLNWLVQLLRAIQTAKGILKAYSPHVVLGTGGYVSAPVLFAAKALKIPYVVHEPDAMPGLVNRMMSRWASLATGAFDVSGKLMSAWRFIATGNPIRSQIHPISITEPEEDRLTRRQTALQAMGLSFDLNKPILIVVGGSQGAKTLNQAVVQALPQLVGTLGLQIIHQSGQKLYEETQKIVPESYQHHPSYQLLPYFQEMWHPLALADLALCRAGSLSLSEMYLAGIPTILVPYPFAAADHQRKNAQASAAAGASIVLEDKECTGENITQCLSELLQRPERIQAMRDAALDLAHPDATDVLVSEILALATPA